MTRPHRRWPLPSGTPCPRCGAPLYWTRDRTSEYCRAPDTADPRRACRYSLRHELTQRKWLLGLRGERVLSP